MKIEYKQGDLFSNLPTDKNIIIPHCANNLGIMGSGFVLPLLKRFPGVDTKYTRRCKERDMLGFVDYVRYDNVTVANMVAQNGVIGKNNTKPIRYAALMKCMEGVSVRWECTGGEIICPKFGSALAGGNWDLIEELINEIWIENKIKVTVFYL